MRFFPLRTQWIGRCVPRAAELTAVCIAGSRVDSRGLAYTALHVQGERLSWLRLMQTAFCPPRGIDPPIATDDLVANTLSAEPDVLDRLESSLPSEHLRQYLVWKDLVRGVCGGVGIADRSTPSRPLLHRS
jgi:hypothetical protein